MGREPDTTVTLLTVYVILLWAFPSQLTVAALGSVGRPSILWGLICLAVWGWRQLIRTSPHRRPPQPVRIAFAAFLAVVWLSYAFAHSSGLPSDEVSPSDSGLIRSLSWAGVLLLANDGITDLDRFLKLLRRIAVVGGLFALLGVAQFATGMSLIDHLSIPGFAFDATASGIDQRAGFTRASSTAAHPLEYAVVLAAALPLAIAGAVQAVEHGFLRRWWSSVSIALASSLSVSRSAIVGTAVSAALMLPALPRKQQRVLLVAGAAMVVGLYVAVPGLIGTFRGLFLGVGQDESTTSRTSAYGVAIDIASNYGPFGRGFGTFLPKYYFLDNQFLLLLVEVGVVGLLAFLSMVIVGLIQTQVARRHATSPQLAIASQALTASIAAVVLLYAFFDAMSFVMSAGTLFLLLGLAGAAANISKMSDGRDTGSQTSGRSVVM